MSDYGVKRSWNIEYYPGNPIRIRTSVKVKKFARFSGHVDRRVTNIERLVGKISRTGDGVILRLQSLEVSKTIIYFLPRMITIKNRRKCGVKNLCVYKIFSMFLCFRNPVV